MRIIPALALLSLLLVPVDAAAAQRFCEPAARKTPNYLAVDFYHLNTPSLPAERHPSGTGPVELAAAPALCLDIDNGDTTNGTSVRLWECNGTGAQQWRVRSHGSVQNPQSGLCLENPGASATPGTRLNFWSCNGSAAQAWKFR